MSNEYVFYSVFVEGEKSDRYICEINRDAYLISLTNSGCIRFFGLVPYERILEYVDLTSALLTRTVLLVKEDPHSMDLPGYLIPGGTKLCLQEISGNYIHVFKSEGEFVEVGERVAYVATGKLEVRNVHSLCSGRIAFIVDMTWEKPRRNLLVVTSELREVVVRKGS